MAANESLPTKRRFWSKDPDGTPMNVHDHHAHTLSVQAFAVCVALQSFPGQAGHTLGTPLTGTATQRRSSLTSRLCERVSWKSGSRDYIRLNVSRRRSE